MFMGSSMATGGSVGNDVAFFDVQFTLSHLVKDGNLKESEMDSILGKINSNRIKISEFKNIEGITPQILEKIINVTKSGEYAKGGEIDIARGYLWQLFEDTAYKIEKAGKAYTGKGYYFVELQKDESPDEFDKKISEFKDIEIMEGVTIPHPFEMRGVDGDETALRGRTTIVIKSNITEYAKGGSLPATDSHSIKSYFQSLNLSMLPEKESTHIKNKILNNPDTDLIDDTDELFREIKTRILNKYPKALPTYKEPAPETVLTKQDYIAAIDGMKIMLDVAKGKEKKNIKEVIRGLETMKDLVQK